MWALVGPVNSAITEVAYNRATTGCLKVAWRDSHYTLLAVFGAVFGHGKKDVSGVNRSPSDLLDGFRSFSQVPEHTIPSGVRYR